MKLRTRLSAWRRLKKILHFDNCFVVEAMNKAGGIIVFWNKEIKIKEIKSSTFTIEVLIEDEEVNQEWWLIGIYASCDSQIRKGQWEVISRRKELWGENWIILGDFNNLCSNEEKWGGRHRKEWSFYDFKNFIHENGMIYIGFERNPWTWSNQ